MPRAPRLVAPGPPCTWCHDATTGHSSSTTPEDFNVVARLRPALPDFAVVLTGRSIADLDGLALKVRLQIAPR
jgi:hypothetical protein